MIAVDSPVLVELLSNGPQADAVEAILRQSLVGGRVVVCGATLARAHARSGDRIAIASYLGTSDTFDRAIAAFSSAYADQNERDYAALDIFVCGECDPYKALPALKKGFLAERVQLAEHKRGLIG